MLSTPVDILYKYIYIVWTCSAMSVNVEGDKAATVVKSSSGCSSVCESPVVTVVLCCVWQSQRSQTEAVTFLANHDDSRALYAIPGMQTLHSYVTDMLATQYHWRNLYIQYSNSFEWGIPDKWKKSKDITILHFRIKHSDSCFLKHLISVQQCSSCSI